MFLILNNKSELSNFFDNRIHIPYCEKYTKAYIVNTFTEYTSSSNDLSKTSLTLEYKKALDSGDFEKFQQIADWLLFAKSMFPNSLVDASEEYYNTLARSAYYKCYIMLRRKWLVYEELAEGFPTFTKMINKSLGHASNDPRTF